jgi:hypothetical protein
MNGNKTFEAFGFAFVGLILILIAKFPNLLIKTIEILNYYKDY